MITTRFAPSPTGLLHIGGARTALFNWLFARGRGGRFLLRIEDTDRQRSDAAVTEAILDDLRWLGLDWDGEAAFQSQRVERHRQAAGQLLEAGRAYRCWCTPEELAEMRERARLEGRPPRYDGRCRERAHAPTDGRPAAVRFRAPRGGVCAFEDMVRGPVAIEDAQLDDLVLLRADGTPTYMLSVVVDDRDMGVTHIIRGEDHLTNAARQLRIYQALGWTAPAFAHIPLIHGRDGDKLSKRHGAAGVGDWRRQGYLPEALCNYLARLGWSHGDDEVFSRAQAAEWFALEQVGKSAARFDADRLAHLNGLYIRAEKDESLCEAALQLAGVAASAPQRERLLALMPALKLRAATLLEIAEGAAFLWRERPLAPDEKAAALLGKDGVRGLLARLGARLEALETWDAAALEDAVRAFAADEAAKLGAVAQPLRAALTGGAVSPGIFDVLAALGRDESLARIGDATEAAG